MRPPFFRLPPLAFWMAPVVLAAWGIVQLFKAEPTPLDIPSSPPAQVQAQTQVETQAQTQAQTAARPPDVPPVPRGLDRSVPKRVSIPSVLINAAIDPIGLRSNGTLETPSYERSKNAAWYKGGPSPGEAGPAVILGHVDNKNDRAVFFDLRQVKVGAKVEISRADGKKVLFTVDSIEQFPKTAFPTERVYGQTLNPTLRLVTCGGKFDRKTQDYTDNIIVFASLAT